MSSRPAWPTERVPGKLGLQGDPVPNKKTKIIIIIIIIIIIMMIIIMIIIINK